MTEAPAGAPRTCPAKRSIPPLPPPRPFPALPDVDTADVARIADTTCGRQLLAFSLPATYVDAASLCTAEGAALLDLESLQQQGSSNGSSNAGAAAVAALTRLVSRSFSGTFWVGGGPADGNATAACPALPFAPDPAALLAQTLPCSTTLPFVCVRGEELLAVLLFHAHDVGT
jgi:hypothetical protein